MGFWIGMTGVRFKLVPGPGFFAGQAEWAEMPPEQWKN